MAEQTDIYDLGLAADLRMMQQAPVDRRRFLKMGVASMVVLLTGCQTAESVASGVRDVARDAAGDQASDTVAASAGEAADAAVCVESIPQETAGPFPADGSPAGQALNALALAGIVRSDIRTSLGTNNTAQGVPCTIELTLVDSSDGCTPLPGYAAYLWHCDRDGNYSMYSSAAVNEDYLRGVQAAGSDGKVAFTSIFPACYPGRWPHAHFEIYRSLDEATRAGNVLHTSQLALPEAVCDAVYASEGYENSVRTLSQISLATDGVFRDGVDLQMASVTGDVNSGYTARLTVGVPA